MLGDNVNLAASLGATSGALQRAAEERALEQGDVEKVTSVLNLIERFLDNQSVGFDILCGGPVDENDPVVQALPKPFCRDCCFDGWNSDMQNWLQGDDGQAARRELFADEFMNGLTFVHLRRPIHYPAVSENDRWAGLRALTIHFREYTSPDGRTFATLASPDGGAFQYLWSRLFMPHSTTPGELAPWQIEFVDIALSDAAARGHHGFLSAAFRNREDYDGTLGIPQLATRDGINSDVATLYTLGPAHAARPQEIEKLVCSALTIPGFVTDSHLNDGVRYDPVPIVVDEQVAANSLSFVLGMVGAGALDTFRYLASREQSCKALGESCASLSDVLPVTEEDTDLVKDAKDTFGLDGSGVEPTDMGLLVTPNDEQLSRDRDSGLFLKLPFNASGAQITLKIDQITGGLNHDGLTVEFKGITIFKEDMDKERTRFVLSADPCGNVQRDKIEFDFQLPATQALNGLDLAFVGFLCDPTEPSCRLPSFRLRQLRISP